MARSTETRIPSVQLEILSIVTLHGMMSAKQLQTHLPAIHPKPLKAHLDALIGLKRLRGVQTGPWGRRYAINHAPKQGVTPAKADEKTMIAQPLRIKPKPQTGPSWWITADDRQFTAAARDRARQMSWND